MGAKVREASSSRPPPQLEEPRLGGISGPDSPATSEDRREVEALATRARAEVEHRAARRRSHEQRDELTCFVLNFELSVRELGQESHIGRALHEDRIRSQRRLHVESPIGERNHQSITARAHAIRAYDQGRAVGESARERDRPLLPEVEDEPLREPIRQGADDCDFLLDGQSFRRVAGAQVVIGDRVDRLTRRARRNPSFQAKDFVGEVGGAGPSELARPSSFEEPPELGLDPTAARDPGQGLRRKSSGQRFVFVLRPSADRRFAKAVPAVRCAS